MSSNPLHPEPSLQLPDHPPILVWRFEEAPHPIRELLRPPTVSS